MRLEAALSIIFEVALNTDAAFSSFCIIASLHFFTAVLSADFLAVFCKVFNLATFTLFIADLMFGKRFTSCDWIWLINISYSSMNVFKKQGKCESNSPMNVIAYGVRKHAECKRIVFIHG
jgi:hypothetical protein